MMETLISQGKIPNLEDQGFTTIGTKVQCFSHPKQGLPSLMDVLFPAQASVFLSFLVPQLVDLFWSYY